MSSKYYKSHRESKQKKHTERNNWTISSAKKRCSWLQKGRWQGRKSKDGKKRKRICSSKDIVSIPSVSIKNCLITNTIITSLQQEINYSKTTLALSFQRTTKFKKKNRGLWREGSMIRIIDFGLNYSNRMWSWWGTEMIWRKLWFVRSRRRRRGKRVRGRCRSRQGTHLPCTVPSTIP